MVLRACASTAVSVFFAAAAVVTAKTGDEVQGRLDVRSRHGK